MVNSGLIVGSGILRLIVITSRDMTCADSDQKNRLNLNNSNFAHGKQVSQHDKSIIAGKIIVARALFWYN
jgi:hypothetical protein